MPITLYDCTTAPSPRRTRILLAEKGLEVTLVQVDLATREQLGEAYRAINPRCTVPALLTEDGDLLTENVAIATYLEALRPDPPMMGKTPIEKANVLEWNARAESEGFVAVAEILRNTSKRLENRALPGPLDLAQIPELAARGRLRLAAFFDVLDARLEGRDHLAAEAFSFADITAYVVVDFARWVKVEPRAEHRDLHRWFEAVGSRQSISA